MFLSTVFAYRGNLHLPHSRDIHLRVLFLINVWSNFKFCDKYCTFKYSGTVLLQYKINHTRLIPGYHICVPYVFAFTLQLITVYLIVCHSVWMSTHLYISSVSQCLSVSDNYLHTRVVIVLSLHLASLPPNSCTP